MPDRLRSADFGVFALLTVAAALVLPPFYYLLQTSLAIGDGRAPSSYGLGNFAAVLGHGGIELWRTTLLYSVGSSALAIVLGVSSAWLVARTDAPFRQTAMISAFLSMAVPAIIKGIGWIMLLGPNSGLINLALRAVTGGTEGPIQLYSLGGMIFVEGVLWTPVVFLLALAPLGSMDPSLEEVAAVAGAGVWQTLVRVTLPLARPSIVAVFVLTLIRSLESFEVPLLIGTPGNLHTFATAIYDSIHTGFLPRYGEASAFAALLLAIVAGPLAYYYWVTKEADRFATVTGKGFRPRRFALGPWRLPFGIWLLVLPLALAAPILILLWASFFPTYSDQTLTDLAQMSLANYRSIWSRSDTVASLGNSALIAFCSASLVAIASFLGAWLVVRARTRLRWALDSLMSLPLVFPGIVLGIVILIEFLHLRWVPIYGTIWILIVAFLIKFMPYGMRFCHAGIMAIHRELEECARTFGAGFATILARIVLPLALPSVLAAWLYVFLYTVRDLSIAVLLSGPDNRVVAVAILDLWNNGEIPELAALSVVLAGAVAILGLMFMWLNRRLDATTT